MAYGHSMSNIISELVLFVRSMPSESILKIFEQCLQSYVESNTQNELLYGILAAIGGWNS
jgi:hypothetical protein